MTLERGFRLDHYQIEEIIGKGGMGEVYRATDTRLPREVAIKTSQQQFSERFAREAKVIASLNHPNICTLFDVGPNYLVMEMIEGPTLSECIKNGALGLEEATGIMRQVADALDYAHERGVVHRDLKPGNIKIRPDGVVKVLDFGLAKVAPASVAPASAGGSAQAEARATVTIAATQAGVVLGTAAYMSPEQAMGKPVDKRADVWAFGVVFYEMLTGARMHTGDSIQEIMAAVLKDQPDLTKVPAQTHRLLKRCLEKDPNKRLRHVGDVMALLDDAPVSSSGPGPISGSQPAIAPLPPEPEKKKWRWPAVAAASSVAALSLAFLYFRPKAAPPAEITRFDIVQPNNVAFTDTLAVSPDGRKLAFVARGASALQIWIRSLDTVEARPLAGTEAVVGLPFWSPDSRYIVFSVPGKLQKIEASGGPAQTLCDITAADAGGFWAQDGRIVFGINAVSPLLQVSAAGGAAIPVATPADKTPVHAYPARLPDGRHFAYWGASGSNAGSIYLGALDAKPGEPGLTKLLPDASPVAFAPNPESSAGNGYLLFRRNGTLMAQPFDSKRLDVAGEAVPVAEQVASFSSSTGVLVYRTGSALGYHLSWFDRQGKPLESAGDTDVLPTPAPALSPDGKRVAFSRTDPQSGNTDIWLYEFARGVPTRFTFDPALDIGPVWSPDGGQIVFERGVANGDLYLKASNMSGTEQLLLKSGGLPVSWSHDGRFLLYQTALNPKTRTDVMVLPMAGPAAERKPWPFANTEFNERGPRFSPDGRFVSYISDESGKAEVYVRPFDPSVTAGSSAAGAKWQISKDGGDGAHWRADGKEILYMAPGGTVMSVDVTTTPVFQAGAAKPLFKSAAVAQFWDLTADGKRLLVPVPSGAASAAPYRVTLNWTAMLRR